MRNFQDSFETRQQSFISAFSFYMTVPLKPLWKHVFYPLDFYKYEVFIKRITRMFKSRFKTFDSKQKTLKVQKDGKIVFQRIGGKCRPT